MKRIVSLILMMSVLYAKAQNTPVESDNLKITMDYVYFMKDALGFHVNDFGEDGKPVDKLVEFYVYLNIQGFDTSNSIDFNKFSLVEYDEKLRQRPFLVNFKSLAIRKYDIENPNPADSFLKYQQDGITDYDHFYITTFPFKKHIVSKQRFYLAPIPAKKNKKGDFVFCFPVKTRVAGSFSLFYKDVLVKNFTIKPGQKLHF